MIKSTSKLVTFENSHSEKETPTPPKDGSFLEKLNTLMLHEKPYLQSDLNLQKLAEAHIERGVGTLATMASSARKEIRSIVDLIRLLPDDQF